MYVGAMLVRNSDDVVITSHAYSVETKEHSVANWRQGGAQLLAEAFADSMAGAAEVVAEETLLTVRSPAQKKQGYLVKASKPKNKVCLFGCKFTTAKNYGFYETKTTQPTFEWDAFEPQFAADPLVEGQTLSSNQVEYDLRIHRAVPIPITNKTLGAGDVVQEFRAIESNSMTLDEPLEHCTAYVWTVRSRFDIDGKTHLTHWGGNYKESDIEKFRSKQTQRSGSVKFNAEGAGFLGQDQQYFYRESTYYFPFYVVEPGKKCKLNPGH